MREIKAKNLKEHSNKRKMVMIEFFSMYNKEKGGWSNNLCVIEPVAGLIEPKGVGLFFGSHDLNSDRKIFMETKIFM